MALLLPFAVLLALLSVAALAAGLGYRKLGEDLAVSTVVSPPTGLVAGVGALVLVLRVVFSSYEPGLTIVGMLFRGLISASVLTAVLSIAFVLHRIDRNRAEYLRSRGRSWGLLATAALTGGVALALGMGF